MKAFAKENESSQEAVSVMSEPATIAKTDLENFMTHTDAVAKEAENISQGSCAISVTISTASAV